MDDMTKHITIFDRGYSREKQTEGLAISEAVATGKCNDCGYLNQCESNRGFQFPVFAWCQKRKHQILKSWED